MWLTVVLVIGSAMTLARVSKALANLRDPRKTTDSVWTIGTAIFLFGALYFFVLKQPTVDDTMKFMEHKTATQLIFKE